MPVRSDKQRQFMAMALSDPVFAARVKATKALKATKGKPVAKFAGGGSVPAAPTWRDTYNRYIKEDYTPWQISRGEKPSDIQAWNVDEGSRRTKLALDQEYQDKLNAYNLANKTNIQADKSMLGVYAQPNRVTWQPGKSGGWLGNNVGIDLSTPSGLLKAGLLAYGGYSLLGGGAGAAGASSAAGAAGEAGASSAPGLWEGAKAAYQAASPYIKGVNAARAVASGNPLAAAASYIPGMDFGNATANQIANPLIKTAVGGGNIKNALGNVALSQGIGAVGAELPTEAQGLVQGAQRYLPMAHALVNASKGTLTINKALALAKSYRPSNKVT